MKIAGITRLSTLDYPNHLCMTIYTQGCTKKCKYCHNKSMIPEESKDPYYPWEEVRSLIGSRLGFIDAVVFSGGEPTLQPDLHEKMDWVKLQGLKVGLHTNGDYLSEIIASKCDYILLSHPKKATVKICLTVGEAKISRVKLVNGKYENQLSEL